MDFVPVPKVLALDTQLHALSPHFVKYCIPAEKCHRLIFSFNFTPAITPYMQPTMRLSGFGYDGKSIGSLCGHNCYVYVKSLQGLRFARDSTGCFTAFKIKDGEQWTEWKGKPELGVDDLELEWDSPQKDLVFHYRVSLLYIFNCFR